MMETIRVTADQQRRIAAAAGGNKQRFCLSAIMGQVEIWEAREIPDGMIRIHPFQEPTRDIPQVQGHPASALEAHQYQAGGNWYFQDVSGSVIGMTDDTQMQKLMPNPDLEHTLTNAS